MGDSNRCIAVICVRCLGDSSGSLALLQRMQKLSLGRSPSPVTALRRETDLQRKLSAMTALGRTSHCAYLVDGPQPACGNVSTAPWCLGRLGRFKQMSFDFPIPTSMKIVFRPYRTFLSGQGIFGYASMDSEPSQC